MAAVKAGCAGAEVKAVVSDDYPIKVTVSTDSGEVLWSASQKKLFRKYASDREQSIKEISAAVAKHCSK